MTEFWWLIGLAVLHGAIGGLVFALASPHYHTLRLPLSNKDLETGFFGHIFVGGAAAIVLLAIADPVFDFDLGCKLMQNDPNIEPDCNPKSEQIYLYVMGLGIIAGYGGLKLISGVSEAMLRDLQQRLARTENETKDFTQHTEKEFKEVKANQLASLATDHVTRNNYKEAVEMCDQALSVDPELIRAWGIKGNALKRLNE